LRITGEQAEIRTGFLPSIILERYRYTNLLDHRKKQLLNKGAEGYRTAHKREKTTRNKAE
jgi:hypothetical protein